MSQLAQFREKQNEARSVILRLRDTIGKEDREFNSEEQSEWEKANKDYDAIGRKIDVLERGDAVSKVIGRGGPLGSPGDEDASGKKFAKSKRESTGGVTDEVRAMAMQAWFLRQMGQPLGKDHVRACKIAGLRPNQRNLDVRLPRAGELRAQSVGTTTAGGFLVPQGFVTSLETALKLWNATRNVAEIIRTESGNPLPWPTVNDTTNAGTLLAENTAASTVDMTFGQTTFNAYKFTSGMVLVSSELEQDNAVDLSNTIGSLLGERIGRGQEGYFTTGTGTSQPAGIVTGSTLGKTGASATAIAADEVFDLFHSVDPAYRSDPSFGFMFHDNVALALRKLKDSQNRYLWQTSMADGQPDRLLNKPVTINQSMASAITTGQKTMIAGAFSKFKIRDAGTIRIRRLVERYGDADQIGFVAFLRSDSKVLNAGGNPIKHYAQL